MGVVAVIVKQPPLLINISMKLAQMSKDRVMFKVLFMLCLVLLSDWDILMQIFSRYIDVSLRH